MKVVSVASDYSNVLWYRVKAVTSGVLSKKHEIFFNEGLLKNWGNKGSSAFCSLAFTASFNAAIKQWLS